MTRPFSPAEYNEILIAEADDGMNFRAERAQLFSDGKRNRAPDAAADHRDLFQSAELRRSAERSDEIAYTVALGEHIELFGRRADYLEYKRYSAATAVAVGNGERYALAFRVDTQYDELSGLDFCRDARRIDFYARDRRIERCSFKYFIHTPSSDRSQLDLPSAAVALCSKCDRIAYYSTAADVNQVNRREPRVPSISYAPSVSAV